MNSKNHILLLLMVCVSIFAYSQDGEVKVYKKTFKKVEAYQQIIDLKSGVLLVRLKTRSSAITLMREKGWNTKADQVQAEQDAINKTIIAAFKSDFTFCQVYFFKSEDSDKVREKEFDQVDFFDSELQIIERVVIGEKNVFTAEFTKIEQIEGEAKDVPYYENGENGLEKRQKSTGGASMGFEALIIKDDQLKQLKRPFPYYERTFKTIFFMKRKPSKVVRKMNAALFKFSGGA